MARRNPKLTGRERDRVLSEYMEMLLGQRSQEVMKLPGARTLAGVTAKGAMALLLLWLPIQLAVTLFAPRGNAPMPAWVTAPVIAGLGLLIVASFAVVITALLFQCGVVGPRRRLWRAAMRKCGHDVCVICGYFLDGRAPASHTCPECGTPDAEQPIPLGTRRSH